MKKAPVANQSFGISPQSAHQFEPLPLYVLIESVPVERSWDLQV